MSRPLSTALAQAVPRQAGEQVAGFAREVGKLAKGFPGVRFAVFPELHPHGTRTTAGERAAEPEASAEPLERNRFTEADRPTDLPLYQGRIDPSRWTPAEGDSSGRTSPCHPTDLS